MAKFYGTIGYGIDRETKPGVWGKIIEERQYFGEINRMSRRLQTTDSVNDNIQISNEISILADPYAYDNFCFMLYVKYLGVRWKVTNVELQYPRLILTLGEVYHDDHGI